MKIVLTSMEEPLMQAWMKHMEGLSIPVDCQLGDIFLSNCEAVVSPANSFGFMDGGIDWYYTQKFGWIVQERLQKILREEYDGELLVGQAVCVPTDDAQVKYVISAPTMRIPAVLPKRTVNPYLAARAALICAKKNNVESIAFPGLGTGIGEVSPEMCALQVRQAIDEVILGHNVFPYSWKDALDRHTYLYTGLRADMNTHLQYRSDDEQPLD